LRVKFSQAVSNTKRVGERPLMTRKNHANLGIF
jgi:hypothetical protein